MRAGDRAQYLTLSSAPRAEAMIDQDGQALLHVLRGSAGRREESDEDRGCGDNEPEELIDPRPAEREGLSCMVHQLFEVSGLANQCAMRTGRSALVRTRRVNPPKTISRTRL